MPQAQNVHEKYIEPHIHTSMSKIHHRGNALTNVTQF